MPEVPTKIMLDESEMPTRWYNLVPDLPSPPPPPLHPGTLQPVGPDDLAPLFPMDLILQEVTTERYVDIPDEVLDVYRLWRPSPLYRAHRLEKALGTPAHIYYKYEGVSPGRLAQAEHRRAAGVLQRQGRRPTLTTETGAGQWGTALAFACSLFGLECEVWQVGASLRPEALPAADDGDVRRHGAPLAVRADRRPAARSSPRPRTTPARSASRSPRRSRSRPRPRHPLRAGQRAQPRAAAPDDHRRGGAAAVREGRRDARPHRRLHRRRVELRRPGVPVPAREAGRAHQPGRSGPSSRRPARR